MRMIAREVEQGLPGGYEGRTSPTSSVSSGSVERRPEEARDRLYLQRVAARDADAATGLELRHKLFTNVIQIRAWQKEMEGQSQEQEKLGPEGLMSPLCVKVIASDAEYREAYLDLVETLSGHEELPFSAATNVVIPSGKWRKVGLGAVISLGCVQKIKNNVRGHVEWYARPIRRPCGGTVLVRYVDAKGVI